MWQPSAKRTTSTKSKKVQATSRGRQNAVRRYRKWLKKMAAKKIVLWASTWRRAITPPRVWPQISTSEKMPGTFKYTWNIISLAETCSNIHQTEITMHILRASRSNNDNSDQEQSTNDVVGDEQSFENAVLALRHSEVWTIRFFCSIAHIRTNLTTN